MSVQQAMNAVVMLAVLILMVATCVSAWQGFQGDGYNCTGQLSLR